MLEHKKDTLLPDLTMLTTWKTTQSTQQEKPRRHTEAQRPGDHRTSAARLRIANESQVGFLPSQLWGWGFLKTEPPLSNTKKVNAEDRSSGGHLQSQLPGRFRQDCLGPREQPKC